MTIQQAHQIAEASGRIANLERKNAKLWKVVNEFRGILQRAAFSRDLYCGDYVAKDYRFGRADLDRYLGMIKELEES